ncbi:hypothetical protein AVEN_27728-1 [Araneus ventricosus]|uniref:Uncharacterized protein n=1 Tax=Araneus ventricosus TaxID=182803 RepID=A0A4Y2RWW1_ARAVE|nr:hypothetical protein AVEN_27728-1 [Araneus ventricosus]
MVTNHGLCPHYLKDSNSTCNFIDVERSRRWNQHYILVPITLSEKSLIARMMSISQILQDLKKIRPNESSSIVVVINRTSLKKSLSTFHSLIRIRAQLVPFLL